jgi:N-acetylneuraminate synthase
MEMSHHHGIENFRKVGCFLFNIINKKYAKKIIVMLPKQKHPLHFHKIKTESFIIISGDLTLIDNKKKYHLKAGDIIHLKKSSWHEFTAGYNGCIFEEISTTSIKKDSYYKNKSIKNLDRDRRKTYFNNWFSITKKNV